MEANENITPRVIELFMRGKKINILLAFIT